VPTERLTLGSQCGSRPAPPIKSPGTITGACLDLLVDTVRKLKRANRGAQALKAHRMIASLTAPRRKRGVAGAIRRILRRSLRGDAGDARRGHR